MGFVHVDTTQDSLDYYQWTGETFVRIGTGLDVSGLNNFALAPLGDRDIAYTDGITDELIAYRFDGDTFTQVGSGLPFTNLSTNYIAALNTTDIAFASNVLLDELNLYRWDGSEFSKIGNTLDISSMNVGGLGAVSSSDVAFYDTLSHELRRFSFDGTDWAQVGSGQLIAHVGEVSISGYADGDVAAYGYWSLEGQSELRRYEWNGDEYQQVGSGYPISGGISAITTVGSDTLIMADRTGQALRRFLWDFTDGEYTEVGTPYDFGTSLGIPAITTVPQEWGAGRAACTSRLDANLLNVNTPYYRVDVANSAGVMQSIEHHTMRASIHRSLFSRDKGFTPARLTAMLDNEHKAFSPEVSGNIFGGNPINRAIKVRVTYQSSNHVRFNGTIDSVKINPERGKRKATIRASDLGKNIKRRKVSIPVQEERNVASLFAVVASHLGLTNSQFQVESSSDVVNVAWWDDTKGAEIIDQILEFGDYKAFIGTDGVLRMRNRYYENENDIAASYNAFYSFGYEFDSDDVANRVEVGFTPYRIAESVGTIAFIDEAIPVAASGWASIKLSYRDQDDSNKTVAAKSITPPTGSDFEAWTAVNSDGDGTGSDVTAQCSLEFDALGASAVATIFNGTGNTAYVTVLQARGYSVQEIPDVSFLEVNSDSQEAYGLQDIEIDNDLIGTWLHARDYTRYLIQELPEPVARCDVAISNKFPDVFVNELGDRLHLSETETGVGSLYVIEGINEQINTSRGLEHRVSYDVRFWRDQGWLILDHAERGKLDSGRLAF